MCRDIDNVAVHCRWPLMTVVAQGRYYCMCIGKRCMTWRCPCCVLYVRFAQGTCFSTRSNWMKSQIGRSFSTTATTLAGSQNPFSMIGFDQNHEQQNKELNMHGGILTLSDECLHRVDCGGTGNCPGHHGV